MYIQNLDEVLPLLRGRLRDYLSLRLGLRSNARMFSCFAHKDETPSMHFNPRTGGETVKCFSCGGSWNIFGCAERLENLPAHGPEFLSVTIPRLCEELGIPLKLGEPSAADKERAKLYKLIQDIADVLVSESPEKIPYLVERNWLQDRLSIGSVSEEVLNSHLSDMGWNLSDVAKTLLIRTKNFSWFGEDKVTFVMKDYRGRPVGFVTRAISGEGQQRYINSLENPVYEKGKHFLGIDVALQEAKRNGLYVVEGPGDLAQLYRVGVSNAVSICGTAFTEQHLLLLKSLGVRQVYLCFDWDAPGTLGTQRVLEEVLKVTSGLSTFVVGAPTPSGPKDPDELLRRATEKGSFTSLPLIPAFEWQLSQVSDNDAPDVICDRMVPIIATEPSAVRRERLIKILSDFTGISSLSIFSDVEALKDNRFAEFRERVVATAELYVQEVRSDPANIQALIAAQEQRVQEVEADFQKASIGVNYQLGRWEALQEERARGGSDSNVAAFTMRHFHNFAEAMSGGMSWAEGVLFYVGGRANSGKTTFALNLGCDVALSDEDAIVIVHSTDDSYVQIEPRIKSALYRMTQPDGPKLSIGAFAQPGLYLPQTPEHMEAHQAATEAFRELLSCERLVIYDSEDGNTLSVLERAAKYYRRRFPSKKLLVISDNTYNYTDFASQENYRRMTMISDRQKGIAERYHLAMLATVEYRKNMPMDAKELRWPVDDDIADSRAFMYRSNVIIHIYNDLHDRKEHAEILYVDERGLACPRLVLRCSKNKISEYKGKMVFDLDPRSVTLSAVDERQALEEATRFAALKETKVVAIDRGRVIEVPVDDPEEGE